MVLPGSNQRSVQKLVTPCFLVLSSSFRFAFPAVLVLQLCCWLPFSCPCHDLSPGVLSPGWVRKFLWTLKKLWVYLGPTHNMFIWKHFLVCLLFCFVRRFFAKWRAIKAQGASLWPLLGDSEDCNYPKQCDNQTNPSNHIIFMSCYCALNFKYVNWFHFL